jgi:uncharacterized membrane protein YphA (DoxX/SURF4 family)
MSEAIKDKCCQLELVFAHTILRLWVGIRLFMAGVDKFRVKGGTTLGREYFEKNLEPITKLMNENALFLSGNPDLLIKYYHALAYGLLISGALCIVGLLSRYALFVGGLIFVSLAFGLLALPDDNAGLMRGIEVAITAFALVTARHNMLSVDGIACYAMSKKKASAE